MEPTTKSSATQIAFDLANRFAAVALPAGFSVGEFIAASKEAFIHAATQDLISRNIRPTTSRIAVMTGLTRAEVARIREGTASLPAAVSAPRTERVMHAWFTDPEYLDEAGNPKTLPEFGAGSFESLVRTHSGDMPRRALLEELISGGMAKRTSDGKICALRRHHVSTAKTPNEMNKLAAQTSLVLADSANMTFNSLSVRFLNEPSPAIRKTVEQRTERFLIGLSDYLHTEAAKHATSDSGRTSEFRVVIGHSK